MTRDQAKQVLVLYRPWVNDSPDAEMAEALALADQDPELGKWFRGFQAGQLAVRTSLRATLPPEAFREQIIAETLARKRATSRRRVLAALTVALVLGVGFEALYLFSEKTPKEEISLPAFANRMSREALRLYRMDLETEDMAQIRNYLASRQSPDDFALSGALQSVKVTGCLATKWQGRPVSMVCFHSGKQLPTGRNSDLYLFVIDKNALPDAPRGEPQFSKASRLTVASWSRDGKIYLLATEYGESELRKLL